MSIKDIVKGTTATFTDYHDGNLWYRVVYNQGKVFSFPVSVEDAKGGVFPAEIKAITLMRWIRIHIKVCEEEEEAAYNSMTKGSN